jgi:hypothetical protein
MRRHIAFMCANEWGIQRPMKQLLRSVVLSRIAKFGVLILAWTALTSILQEAPIAPVVRPVAVEAVANIGSQDGEGPPYFRDWLAANPSEGVRYEALKAYLAREGVGDVLPVWQLVQTETVEAATKCEIAGFAIPPETMWPSIVPTLRLVRQEIVPLVGPVKVLSSFRTAEANSCAAGAEGSPHRSYRALDLATVNEVPQKELFAKLCKRWDQLSPDWRFGLGAYYTKYQPTLNQEGRFHVDTMGRRTWGFGYGAYTSHCRELGYISVKSPAQIKAEEEAKLKAEADALAKAEADAKAMAEEEAKAKLERDKAMEAEKRLKAEAAKAQQADKKKDAFEVKIMAE